MPRATASKWGWPSGASPLDVRVAGGGILESGLRVCERERVTRVKRADGVSIYGWIGCGTSRSGEGGQL